MPIKFNNCLDARSAAAGTWRTRAKDDDDNTSLGSSVYSQPSVLGDEYPPSPHAGSVTTRGSTTALTSGNTQPLYDQHEKNYNNQQYYRDFNQGPPEQFDVYNDFNNNLRSYNHNEEISSNPSSGALAGSNAYSKNNLSGKDYDLPGEEKGDKTFPSPDKTPTFSMDPSPIVNMDFTVTAMVDNRGNWLPFYFKSINVQ
ncbi:827_t:CDS:2, partial [Racocetra fulgida]